MRTHEVPAGQFKPGPYLHEDCQNKMSRVLPINSKRSSASIAEEDDQGASHDGEALQGHDLFSADDSAFNKNNSPMYALRPNPKRSRRFADGEYSILIPAAQEYVSKTAAFTLSKKSRVCEKCGKEFSSWKALIEHMRCHSDLMPETHRRTDIEHRGQVLNSQSDAHGFDTPLEKCSNINRRSSQRWMKGKRSKRLSYIVEPHHQARSDEQQPSQYDVEAEMANCLVMLSSAVDLWGSTNAQHQAEEQSITSQLTHMKIPITTRRSSGLENIKSRAESNGCEADPSQSLRSKKTLYKCKACKKNFHSFQALGGHRASHNKLLKGCCSRMDALHDEENHSSGLQLVGREDPSRAEKNLWNDFSDLPLPKVRVRVSSYNEETDESPFVAKKVSKVHGCSICHRIFYSGQALGGHKRCHRLTAGTSDTTSSTISTTKEYPAPRRGELLDLNLPAPIDDDDGCIHMQPGTLPQFI